MTLVTRDTGCSSCAQFVQRRRGCGGSCDSWSINARVLQRLKRRPCVIRCRHAARPRCMRRAAAVRHVHQKRRVERAWGGGVQGQNCNCFPRSNCACCCCCAVVQAVVLSLCPRLQPERAFASAGVIFICLLPCFRSLIRVCIGRAGLQSMFPSPQPSPTFLFPMTWARRRRLSSPPPKRCRRAPAPSLWCWSTSACAATGQACRGSCRGAQACCCSPSNCCNVATACTGCAFAPTIASLAFPHRVRHNARTFILSSQRFTA